MKRILLKVLFVMVFMCLAFGLTQPALAGETFQTTDHVRFRTGPSTEDSIISVVNPGVSVDVLEHDPAGWSMVRVNGTVGYMRSDFLKYPIGSTPVVFRTTDGVNFRTSPSNDTNTNIIRGIVHGTSVEVLEHDPAGWSKVRITGTTGFIRSDFLTRDIRIESASSSSQPQAQPTLTLWATAGARLRSGPSTDTAILRTLSDGTAVTVIEHNPTGWSKVSVGGDIGYIRTDLLRTSNGKVEFLNWSEARNIVRTGVPIRVYDVRTGLSFNIQCFSKSGHADVEPISQADTDTILRSRNGVWAWAPRPVLITIGDRTIAASMNGMPHAGSTISGNGMNGHLCLHFGGTVTNNKSYQQDLRNAVDEAYNSSR